MVTVGALSGANKPAKNSGNQGALLAPTMDGGSVKMQEHFFDLRPNYIAEPGRSKQRPYTIQNTAPFPLENISIELTSQYF